MTQQEQNNNIAAETERFMQGRYSFGIQQLLGMQINFAEFGRRARQHYGR